MGREAERGPVWAEGQADLRGRREGGGFVKRWAGGWQGAGAEQNRRALAAGESRFGLSLCPSTVFALIKPKKHW
jgi:hypothetical protein